MIKTIVIIKKGKLYSDAIFNFITNVFEKRIPESERQTLSLVEGKELDGFRNYLKNTFNVTSRFIEDHGKGSSVFKNSDAFIIQIQEKYTNVFAKEESQITDDFIKGNTLSAAFIDSQYPIKSDPPKVDPPKVDPPKPDNSLSKSPFILVGAALLLIFLFKK